MRMTSIFLGLLLGTPTFAAPFGATEVDDLPATKDLDYTFTNPSASGTFEIEFLNGGATSNNDWCGTGGTDFCHEGDFVTDDGGKGDYAMYTTEDSCTGGGNPAPTTIGTHYVQVECDLSQYAQWSYVYDSPPHTVWYGGSAEAGSGTYDEKWQCYTPTFCVKTDEVNYDHDNPDVSDLYSGYMWCTGISCTGTYFQF